MAEDRLDKSLGVVLTATVTVIVLCYMAIPTIMDAIGSLKEDSAQFAPLITLTVTMMIIGLIIVILRGYNSKTR